MDFSRLEFEVKNAVLTLREIMQRTNQPRLDLTIEVDGRSDGDLRIVYKFGSYSQEVQGASLGPVVEEYLRRSGWAARNHPVCLPPIDEPPIYDPREASIDDSVPF